ncbi:MAG TPA: hypothetical protein VEM35_08960, partial [Rhizomicrobium sp.]|nr:hypothetical protein [Rhizomicrobium sp.]
MYRYFSCVIFASALIFAAGTSAVLAQPVERSGNTFHRVVCPGPVDPQSARCHAHIVTDANGNALERGATPQAVPSGYGATTLQTAYGINPANGSSATVIAIVDAYGYDNAESDLAVYRSTMGLPPCSSGTGCFTKYNQNGVKGNYPRPNN